MRKFLFFILAAWLSVGSGWADTIKVSKDTKNPEYVYVVHCARMNQLYYWSSTGKPVKIINAVDAANAAKFAFFAGEKEGDYYIYSIDDSKFVSYDNTKNIDNGRNFSTNVDTQGEANVWNITAGVKDGVSYYEIRPYNSKGQPSLYVNWYQGIKYEHNSLGLWQQNGSEDPGSSWAIVSASPDSPDSPEYPDYIVSGRNYYITVNSNSSWDNYFGGATEPDYTSYKSYNNDISKATTFSVNYYGVNKEDASNPKMYTITDNKRHELLAYKTIDDAASSVVPLVGENSAYSNNTTWTFKPKTITKDNNNGKTTGFVVFPWTTSSYAWNKHGGTLGLWGNYNQASVAVFVPADKEAMNDLLSVVKGLDYVSETVPAVGSLYRRSASAFYNQSDYTVYDFETAKQLVEAYYEEPKLISTVNYTLTDGAGTIYTGTVSGVANERIFLTGAEGATFANENWTNNGNDYSATISFDFPVSSANTKNYTYIGVASSNQRLLFAQSGDNGAYNVKCDNDANTISNMTNGSTKAFEWAIYPSCANGVFTFTIQNRLAEKYINIVSGGPNALCPLSDTGYGYDYDNCIGTGKGFHLPGTNNFISINNPDANDQNLFVWEKYDGASHLGSNLAFFKPTNFDSLMTEMRTAYNSISDYFANPETLPVIGSGTGEYTAASYDAAIAYITTKENYSTYGNVINGSEYYKAAQFTIATTTMNSFVEARNGLTINQPTPGFYYIRNKGTQNFVKGDIVNDSRSVVSLQSEQDANAIFYIDANKNIMAYENGAYWKNVYRLGIGEYKDNSSDHNTFKDPWEFSEGNSIGSYYLRYGTNDQFYAIASSETSTGHSKGVPANDNGSWELIKVTTLPLTIGTNGWSTFSAPVNVALPAGVKAFYVKSGNQIVNNALTLDDVEGNIPANQGVIIKGTEKETIYFSIEDAAEPANLTGNQLVANVDGNKITGTGGDGIYAFATYQSKTGFMKLMTTVTLGGHKCYLKLTNQAGSASFLSLLVDGDDDLTGVEGVDTEVESDGIVYDLFGRKISQPQKGSLYIRNGRKFIAK